MSGHRPERVADLIRRELARLIPAELRDPRVGFVTITAVRVSADLRHAKVYVTFLDRDEPDEPLEALNRAAGFLRRSLFRALSLRHAPELRFLHDASLESGMRVDRLLERIDRERARAGDAGDAPDDAAAPPRPDGPERGR